MTKSAFDPTMGGEFPIVITQPMQRPEQVQPTLGRIALGVFLGNMATGVVGGIIWMIATL